MKLPRQFIQNVVVDSIAFVSFLFLTTTGLLMKFILPPGSGHHTTIWGYDRHIWGEIHFWVAMIMFGALALHLFLHWNWIQGVFTGKPGQASGQRFMLGIIGVIAVILLAISPLISPKEIGENQGRESEEHESDHADDFNTHEIRGYMTLEEIERTTGVPAAYIIEQLQLPVNTLSDEKLGHLRNEHGFSMDEAREIIHEYNE